MRHMMIAILLAAAAGNLGAQDEVIGSRKTDNLTPTDILGFAEVSATARLRASIGTRTFGGDLYDIDLDTEDYRFILEGGVGIGMGFEVEAEVPYLIRNVVEGDGDVAGMPAELDVEAYSIGDLTLRLNYAAVRETVATPQVVVGLVTVMPTGYGKEPVAGVMVNNIVISDKEKGGIGEGIIRYGLVAMIGKDLQVVEPYAGVGYVFGGTHERKGVDYDRSDYGILMAGAELHLPGSASVDVRGTVFFQGVSSEEDQGTGELSTAEKHKVYNVAGHVYVPMGGPFTLVVGAGFDWVEKHEVDAQEGLVLKSVPNPHAEVGIHLYLD